MRRRGDAERLRRAASVSEVGAGRPFRIQERGGGWGREDDDDTAAQDAGATLSNNDYTAVAATVLEGLGGADNIASLDNCITRLRMEVKDRLLVDEKKIKSAGGAGVIRPGKNSVQVIIGTKVQFVADEFKKLL